MIFTITTAGMAAAVAAQSSGPAIQITNISVGSAVGYTPNVGDTALHGTVLYSAAPSNYTVLDANDVQWTLNMDFTVGNFSFGEVGLFLGNGTLFALASLTTLQQKLATSSVQVGNNISLIAQITLSNLAAVVSFPLTTVSLAKFLELTSIDLLNPPVFSNSNAYICHSNDDGGNPIFALRSADYSWGFPTHSSTWVSGTVTGNGTGYSTASVNFVGGGGTGAAATPTITSGAVTGVALTAGGWGQNYTSAPQINITGNVGSQGALASCTITQGVTSYTGLLGGSGYTTASVVTSGGGGAGFVGTCTVASGQVTGITIVNPGYGFTSTPTFLISGNGVGASATPVVSGCIQTITIPQNTVSSLISVGLGTLIQDLVVGRYIIEFTSGGLNGLVRLITSQANEQAAWSTPLGSAPTVGSTFNIYKSNYATMQSINSISDDAFLNALLFGGR